MKLPGTLWNNNGYWNWRVKLPGEGKRKNYPLRAPGAVTALEARGSRKRAEAAAWRIWEKAVGTARKEPEGGRLDDLLGMYYAHAESYYRRKDGTPTREADNCKVALRRIREAVGNVSVEAITYKDLLEIRNAMVPEGYARRTINKDVGHWRRFFTWALENALLAPEKKAELCAIMPLKAHRSRAREPEPVVSVPHKMVKATLPALPPSEQAMVCLMELSGMRPGEMCLMRAGDIQQRAGVWLYRPGHHKNAHLGQPRVVVLGRRAQAVLAPWLKKAGKAERCVFTPAMAEAERAAYDRANRQSNVQPSQVDRKASRPKRKPSEVGWTTDAFAKAVHRACLVAGIEPWHPNQLRHSCGTRVRRKFGADIARAVLGHSAGQRITNVYTHEAVEKEFIRLASVAMKRIG